MPRFSGLRRLWAVHLAKQVLRRSTGHTGTNPGTLEHVPHCPACQYGLLGLYKDAPEAYSKWMCGNCDEVFAFDVNDPNGVGSHIRLDHRGVWVIVPSDHENH